MEILKIEDFKKMWQTAFDDIKAGAEEFSKLDAVIGDGDHGEAIVTAMTEVVKVCESGVNFKAMLNDMAFGVMLNTSGSTSTLLGAFLLGMSDAAPEGDAATAEEVKAIFKSGLDSIQKNTAAKVGDKTMMDAVIPAVEAIEACDSSDVSVILAAGAEKALEELNQQ